jgi:hypothetical protein
MYDVFISYRASDRPTAKRIAKYLKARGFLVWFDLWELMPGKPWSDELERALLQSQTVVVVVGSRGIGSWQSAEYKTALTKVAGTRDRIVIPIITPEASIANIPFPLQQYTALSLADDEDAVLDRLALALNRYRSPLQTQQNPPPKVFLCHAKEDGRRIENLYFDLRDRGLDPWYDKENLVVGDQWESEIIRAIEESDFFAIFISETSRRKRGFIQKEIRTAVREYQRRPEESAFLLPVRLEACKAPRLKLDETRYLTDLQWADVFEDDEDAIDRLSKGILAQWRKKNTN